MDIKRDDAIAEIRQALCGATNDQIADALEMLVGDERLANYRITKEGMRVTTCESWGNATEEWGVDR